MDADTRAWDSHSTSHTWRRGGCHCAQGELSRYTLKSRDCKDSARKTYTCLSLLMTDSSCVHSFEPQHSKVQILRGLLVMLQGIVTFNSLDPDKQVQVQTLRSNDTVVILPGVVHSVGSVQAWNASCWIGFILKDQCNTFSGNM